MKNYLFSMICAAGVMMFAACDDDNSSNGANGNNPVAGTDGYWCWKVTTTVLGNLPQVTYMWDKEDDVKLYVSRLKSTGLDVSYEKSSAKDYNECSELENNSGDENQGNIDDFFNTTKKYEQSEPGIYVNSEGELVAKGIDGSVFMIDDTSQFLSTLAMYCEPFYPAGFQAWDGKSSIYSFSMDYYNDNDGNAFTSHYEDTIGTVVVAEYPASGLYSIDAVKLEFTMPFMSFDDYNKIAEAGDFETTYKTIAKMLQKAGPIVVPADMIQKYTKFDCQWLSDRYPAAMEQAKYVIPYTGSGNIKYMRVDREFEGGKTPNGYVWLYPCNVDDVVEIEVVIENVSKEDAAAYIQKVKTEGVYSQFNENNDIFTANSDNYYDEDVHGPAPEGTKGFVFPTYSVLYVNGNLIIKYTLSKVMYV